MTFPTYWPAERFIDDLMGEALINGADADEMAVCERIVTDLGKDPATLIAEYEREKLMTLSAVNEFSFSLAVVYHKARNRGYKGIARKVKRN